jgi:hypothetical protein
MTRRKDPESDPPTNEVAHTEPTAQHLVAAWVDGYREAREGRDPHPTLVRRVAGQCRAIAKDCKTVEHWRTAWRGALAAGRAGKIGIALFLADEQPRPMYVKQGPGEQVRSLAERRAALKPNLEIEQQ